MRVAPVLCVAALAAACGDNESSNLPPVFESFDLSTPEDQPVMTTLSVSDPEGAMPSVALRDAPAHGTVTVTGLTVLYTPEPNYHGADLFSLVASDGRSEVVAAVDVTVTPVNDAPVGVADEVAGTEDVASVIAAATLLQNDTDIDGDTLTITAVSGATDGTVALAGTDVTFTPEADFVGDGTFVYTLSDGTATVDVTVTVAIGGANDAPVAVDDAATTNEDTAVTITNLLANDTDAEAQALSITAVGTPSTGTVTLDSATAVTYTPPADFNGTATFEYTVSDGVATDTGTVTVTVNGVNDAPIAVDDSATTDEDTALVLATLAANDTDIDSATLTVTAVGTAANGTVTVAGGTVTYTPAANFNGTDSFEYTVSDGALTDTGTVSVTVNAVNDAPIAVDDTGTTAEDTAVVLAALTANDVDVDSATLTVTAVGNAVNGTVDLNGGSPRFTPAANFDGTASFEYTVSDGALTDVGLVTITVTPVNDPPIAVDDTAIVQQDGVLTLAAATLLANDSDGGDGGALSITAVDTAQNGTVALAGTTITFTPDTGFVGAASFQYVVSDGTDTDVGLVVIDVTAGPICGDGQVETPEVCDDNNLNPGDGCDASCQSEPGFTCTGEPSACTTTCGDGIAAGPEACDDGDADETDGCTTACVIGALCDATEHPSGDAFAVDPDTGHCYVMFQDTGFTFAAAQADCAAAGGYLTTITSAAENARVAGLLAPTQQPWIGASEDGNDTDDVFDWVTDEPFTFKNFATGQPDDDAGTGGNGECLHMFDTGTWNDTNCDLTSFVVGHVCEVEPQACGDSVLQAPIGEECDDSNALSNDGCSSTCQLEVGCGNGTVDAGEECDDDNLDNGDGCSSTCENEPAVCGNGVIEVGETCDDGNTASFDGCNASCAVELGAVCTATAPTLCAKLVINELEYDQPGADTAEFVEVTNVGTGPADLTNIRLVLVNGSNATEYFFDGTSGSSNVGKRISLAAAGVPGNSLPPNGIVVIGGTGLSASIPSGVFSILFTVPTGGWLQNGAPDAVGLFDVARLEVVDAISYEGAVGLSTLTDVPGSYLFVEGGTVSDLAPTPDTSLQRTPNGRDTNSNSGDFVLAPPTPGLPTP